MQYEVYYFTSFLKLTDLVFFLLYPQVKNTVI